MIGVELAKLTHEQGRDGAQGQRKKQLGDCPVKKLWIKDDQYAVNEIQSADQAQEEHTL